MSASKYLDRAEKELSKKRFDAAIALFEQVIAIDPDSGPARAGKRRAELQKHAKSYPSSLTRLIRNLPHSIAIGIGKLCRLHRLVASHAEKALSSDPRNVKLNLTLGRRS